MTRCDKESAARPEVAQSPIRVALVAPHTASRNGIGDYTARLVEELRWQAPACSITLPVDGVSPEAVQNRGDAVSRALPPCWSGMVLKALDAAGAQVAHIQHGLYMGHGRELRRFLVGLRVRRIPCVVTLHGVWRPTAFRRWPVAFYRLLAASVDRVIVHQRDEFLELLLAWGIPADRTAVIPHGTWTSDEAVPPTVQDLPETGGRRVVLFAGNIFRRKGLHVVIRAFPDVVRKIPDVCLLVVGHERANNPADRLYCLWLHRLMRRGLKEGWLVRRAEYVSDGELWERIAAADVVVFPYLRRYGSASGVFHRILAAGRPSVCSNVPTFFEAAEAWGARLSGLLPPAGDVDAWSHSLSAILSDEPLRRRAMEASAMLARETSWCLAARQHLQLYRSLLPPIPRSA